MKKDVPVALVIENPILLLGFQEIVSSIDGGFKVVFTGSDAQEFLEDAGEEGPYPEICLLDIPLHAPDTQGIMERLMVKMPNMKILLLSPFGNTYSAKKALAYGASGFITINSNKEEVHRALLNIRFTGEYFENQLHVKDRQALQHAANSSAIENRLMSLLSTDMSIDEIAEEMNLGADMVEECVQILYEKFAVTSRVGLAVHAYEMGLLGE